MFAGCSPVNEPAAAPIQSTVDISQPPTSIPVTPTANIVENDTGQNAEGAPMVIEFEKGDIYVIEGSRISIEFTGAATAHTIDDDVFDSAWFTISEGGNSTEIYLETGSQESAETIYGDYKIALGWAYGYTQSCGIIISKIAK